MQKIEDNEIVTTECGYTVKTEKKYSSLIRGDNITVAYSKERKELIIYDQDFIMVKKMTEIKTLQEYQYENVVFVVFVQYGRTMIMALRDGKYDILELLNQYHDNVSFDKMIDIEPKKYLVIGCYNPYVEGHGYCRTKYVSFVLNLNNGTTLSQIDANSTYRIIGKRFLICGYMYDLYTMTKMERPKEIETEITDIEVCYSSKQIIVVKILNNYYVYINGKIVYTYLEEEHEQILLDLRNHYTETKQYCTVIIKNEICIWSKKEQPQVISISK